MTVRISPQHVAMRGTEQQSPRCIALKGDIGSNVHCSIYALRASPCREFQASWVDGVHNERCDRARAEHGLPPLSPARPETPMSVTEPVPAEILNESRSPRDLTRISGA